MKIALAMIVKGSWQEAEYLKRCLHNVAPHVDGVFITITHKHGEERNKDVEAVAKEYNAVISDFEWCHDFSAARNFNFSQVPKDFDYILWLDADDTLNHPEKIKETIEKNPADGYLVKYLYAFDEHKHPIVIHHKTQIVRNDGCVTWKGALHEDFAQNRKVEMYLIDDLHRIHHDEMARFNNAKERNLEVAQKQLEREPSDPRSYWNVANCFSAMAEWANAIEMFDIFLSKSESEEEKYIAFMRKGECLWHLGEKNKAIDTCRYAIGLRPGYPDAYSLLGSILLESQRLPEAREMLLAALTRKPPYHSIIVYNPRDYDYVPLMNLAKVYIGMSMPSLALECLKACLQIYPDSIQIKQVIEAIEHKVVEFEEMMKQVKRLKRIKNVKRLENEINELPVEIQSHPMVCNLRNTRIIKKESSGKDLVIFCSNSAETWTPETAKTKGIGGSEEAVLWLSKLLVKRGWNVTVYNNCGHKQLEFDGVIFKPFWSWNYRDKQDAVILWRSPVMCDYDINATNIYVDLHDVIEPGEFNEKRLSKITKIFVKSAFHRSLFPDIADDKFVIVPNGIDSAVFSGGEERDRYLLINTSSPDRSLSALVDCWPEIKKEVPEAKLMWAYGWKVWDTAHSDNPAMLEWKQNIQAKIETLEDFYELGRLGHDEVADLYKKAGIFAYPTEFAEIDCISLSKAMAAGAYPVATDFAALGEKTGHGGTFIHSDKNKDNWCLPYQKDFSLQDEQKRKEWVDAVVKQLKKPDTNVDAMRQWAQKTFDWENIANVWHEQLSNHSQK